MGVTVSGTLRAPLSGTFLQRKEFVNQCLEYECQRARYMCVSLSLHVHTRARACVYSHICAYIQCVCECVCACLRACMHSCVSVYVHVRMLATSLDG